MTEPTRIRAAVVVSALADLDDTHLAAFSPRDRASAEGIRARLRGSGDRRRIAEAVVAERLAIARAREPARASEIGAALYARWMRSMDAATRARVARSLDAPSIDALASHVRHAAALRDPERTLTAWLLGVGARSLGRLPSVDELSTLLEALRGGPDVASRGLVRWERHLRVAGRREACEGLARSLVRGE